VHARDRAATDRESRTALRDAARRIDRARGPLRRRDPDEALAIWRGLVEARWSLVDHFDSDGRRFLIVERNDPRLTRPEALSDRERQVLAYRALGHSLKLIGYELGLSIATVSETARTGMRRLGVQSIGDLARVFAGEPPIE